MQINSPVKRIRLLNTKSFEEIRRILEMLNAPKNKKHLAYPPDTREKIISLSKQKGTHIFVGVNESGIPISTCTIVNSEYNMHELSRLCVHPKYHRKKPRARRDDSIGAGRFTVEQIMKWGFENPMPDGRERTKYVLGIMKDIEGWHVMEQLVLRLGFEAVAEFRDQVTREGKNYNVKAYELLKKDWLRLVSYGSYATY